MAEGSCKSLNSSNKVNALIGEPLDSMQIKISCKNGVQKTVSALNIGFMETRQYVLFTLPPLFETDMNEGSLSAAEMEWLECMSFFEDDLCWLLKLPYHRFWSQVLFDENLHVCLESYLSRALRDYDLKNFSLKEDISCVLKRVHKLVFLVNLRMSTYKESKEHHMRPEAFAEIIYDNFLFDVPKIMDLCVLYGFRNGPLVSKMVQNIFSTQPKYQDDLMKISQFVLNTLSSADGKLFVNGPLEIGDFYKVEDALSKMKDLSLTAFYDVINYITDISATIYAFLEIYSSACQVFCQNGAVARIGSFYERVFPAVEKGLKKLSKISESERIIEGIERNIMLSKTFLIKTFRNILSFCYIQPILNFTCSESRNGASGNAFAEDFLEVFVHLVSKKIFLCDYSNLYPFESDLELFSQAGVKLDQEYLNYVFGGIHDASLLCKDVSSVNNDGSHEKIALKNLSNDIRDLHSIAAILKPESSISKDEYCNDPAEGASKYSLEDFQIESLIQCVCDVLPSLGDGFVLKCLEHYSYDAEKVIDAIFTESLSSALSQLDRDLKREDRNTVEHSSVQSILSDRKSIFDNDEFDVFSRSDVNTENIHMGKKNKTPTNYQNLEKGEDSEFLKQIILTYGTEETEYSRFEENIYEDEYDDTYDSVMVGLKEPALEGVPDQEEPADEKAKQQYEITESENMKRDNSLDFCVDPAILREKAEQRRQSKMARNQNFKDVAPTNHGNNRQHKDRHKAQVANHNRRKQSDFKKSRGMMPS